MAFLCQRLVPSAAVVYYEYCFFFNIVVSAGWVFNQPSQSTVSHKIHQATRFSICFQCNPFFCFYRKVQDALEKQNRENFKKRDHEKRKVDEATEKAKELMRVKPSFLSLNAARATSIQIGLYCNEETTTLRTPILIRRSTFLYQAEINKVFFSRIRFFQCI